MSFTAKTVVCDFTTHWNTAGAQMCREIDFYSGGTKLALTKAGGDYVTFGNEHSSPYETENLFDTSNLLDGAHINNGWQLNTAASVRVIVVFDTPQTFDSIIINNHHDSGGATVYGVKDTLLYITDTAYTVLDAYGTAVTGGTKIFDGVFPQHAATNTVQDFELTLIGSGGGATLPTEFFKHIRTNHVN